MFTKSGARVEAEAAALRRAHHPGVVELVDVTDGVLRTRWIEGRPLAAIDALPPEEIAGLAAAVATTLADLHQREVHHGGLDASHVLVTTDGQPVLCSFGRPGRPRDDVADWGALVGELLATSTLVGDGRPGASAVRARRPLGPMLAPPTTATLTELAELASAPDPDERPGAAELAAAIRQRVPDARLPRARPTRLLALDRPSPVNCDARGRGRLGRVGALVATLAVVVAVALVGYALVGGTERAGRMASPTTSPPTTSSPRSTERRAAPPSNTTTTRAAPALVWPREATDFRDGVLSARGARYELGRVGDVVVQGDWSCTGRATVALLRPTTGEVFAFDGWAEEGRDVVGRAVGAFPGATDLRVADLDADGCADLQALNADATPAVVAIVAIAWTEGR